MKHLLFILSFFGFALIITAQEHSCAKIKQATIIPQNSGLSKPSPPPPPQISHEIAYDVKFVHLNLNLERTNKYISGGVKTVARVNTVALDTFMTLLHLNFTIDSIRLNGSLMSFIRQDSMVKVGIALPLPANSSFTTIVYYKGTAPAGGSALGSGFNNATSPSWGNQATWSLSESFVAYHWWPCKQILTDKIDSSWVYVTTDSTNKVGSNGILQNVVVVGNKKRYEWKSRAPIDYYLISVAVAKYKEYNLYAKPQYLANDSILIQNYIYDNAFNSTNWSNTQKVDLNKMPQVLNFLSNLYGMYPFYKEKYGHCMAPVGGGMEHQTMSTIGFFDYYIDAHELAHQWWGDAVTCKSWGDIWINEGFASYSEHLVAEYLDPGNFAANLNAVHLNVMGQPGGSIHFTGADTLKTSRIFSSRLTYDKGGAIVHSLRFLTNNDSLWFNTLRGFQNTYKNSTASAIDFQNYYQAQTSINPSVFFNQWYYGEGYPTFNARFNYNGTKCVLTCTQTVSMPSATPLFVTPLEYRISRQGKADTIVRLLHSTAIESYTLNLIGTVTGMTIDPKNWIINKTIGPVFDPSIELPVIVVVPPDTTGITQSSEEFNSIVIGPNPTKGMVMISNPAFVRGNIIISDLTGKLISEKSLEKESTVDLSNYANGLYIIKLTDQNHNVMRSQKIVKQ